MSEKFTWWRINGSGPTDSMAAILLTRILRNRGAKNIASRTDPLDTNHLVTQQKYADLKNRLAEGELLITCFRNGFCGVRTWIAHIENEEQFHSLLMLTETIIVERWYAIPAEQFKALTAVARKGTEAIGADPSYC